MTLLKQYIKTTHFARDVNARFGRNKTILKSDAEWLKHRLQDMGPTYVKIGQFISARRDIFDKNVVESLKDLQDKVTPMDKQITQTIIENNLPLNRFSEIELTPIASASIGQVHRAVLKGGEKVVLKIKRPGIENTILSDIHILTNLLNLMELSGMSNINETKEIIQDFQDYVIQETNFENEMNNMKQFYETNKTNKNIYLPRLRESLCTQNVIVMDYIPSTKFSIAKKTLTREERSALAYRLMDLLVLQFIQDGIIHGDPHEGNIAVSDDGKLVVYDLGNMVTIEPGLRTLMKQLIFEIMVENIDAAIDVMKRISLIDIRDENRLRVYLLKYVQYVKTIDVKVLQVSDKEVFEKLPVKFDGIIFRLIRVFGIIEGICKDLDPSFNYNSVFVKYLDTLVMDKEFVDYKIRSDMMSMLNMALKFLKP